MAPWKRKRDGFFDDEFFRILEEELREIENHLNKIFRDISEMNFNDLDEDIVYGFSIQAIPGKKPIVRRFGKMQKNVKAPVDDDDVFVDIINDKNNIKVLVDLPGFSAENIKVETSSNRIYIKALNNERRVNKVVYLPCNIKGKPASVKYNNGVLEIICNKM
ncbi:MAG TPA: Hsp20/alpha crystallin family protein [Candidatus Altiarchaeales archaeon]|nr:Hsp20/alpha crystallin family protein [Candidatus Altiarchaeales archaeon]